MSQFRGKVINSAGQNIERAVHSDDLNNQVTVRALLPLTVEEVTGYSSDKIIRKVNSIICMLCGYQSKKWTNKGKCLSKVDCDYRVSHPDVDPIPYYYGIPDKLSVAKFILGKAKESMKKSSWTEEEVDDQIFYIKERFGV